MSHQAVLLGHSSVAMASRERAPASDARGKLIVALLAAFICGASGGLTAFGPTGYEAYFWMIADVLILSTVVTRNRYMIGAVSQNVSLMMWPALAMVSALWSYSPYLSLYHGLQLLMTILLGFYVCSLRDFRDVLVGAMLGLAVTQCASIVAVWMHSPDSVGYDGAWAGSFPHKNVLGFTMVFQALICISLLPDRSFRYLAGPLLLASVTLILLSKSGTSIISLIFGVTPFLLWLVVRRGTNVVGIAAGALIFIVSVLLLLVVSGVVDPESAVLGTLGKDSTLTGRTELWRFGMDQFWKTPYIGIGYQAYWGSALSSAAYLRYVIHQDLWFFHNNFVDVAVAFGVLGIAVFAFGLLFGFITAIRIALRDREWVDVWRISFMVSVIVLLNAEGPLFTNHSLIQTFFAIAVAPKIIRDGQRDGRTVSSRARLR